MTTVPWDYSTPKEGVPSVENAPSPEGIELGREMARLADLEEERTRERFPDMMPRCDDCAVKLGTYPNQCVSTLMDVIKCVSENQLFYCHKGIKEGEAPKSVCRGYMLLVTAEATVQRAREVEWQRTVQPWTVAMGVTGGRWFPEPKQRDLSVLDAQRFVEAFAKKSPIGCARAVAADGTVIARHRTFGFTQRAVAS